MSVHRAAHRAYYVKIDQLRYKGLPVSLDDLAAIQRKSDRRAEVDFDLLQAKLEKADRLSMHFINSDLTSVNFAEMQLLLEEDPDFLRGVLVATEADSYWSRPRFDSLEDLRREPVEKLTLQMRSAARFLQRVSRYSMETGDVETAVQCAMAILRLSDLLAAQPSIDQCFQCFAVRGMGLDSVAAILNTADQEQIDVDAIRSAVHSMDADSAYLAMIDTERALAISTHEAAAIRLWPQHNGVVSLLNFLETGTSPNGFIGGVNFRLRNDDLLIAIRTSQKTKDRLTEQEDEIDKLLDEKEL